MNINEAISKIETIVSRKDDPIHIGGWESIFEGKPLSTLCVVKEIYLFGSAVYFDEPRDIDLIVIIEIKEHFKFRDERKRKHSSSYWEWYSPEQLVKKTLRKKMRNVDIHVYYDAYKTGLVTDLKFLVWSPEKTNIKENFVNGRNNIDLKEECRNLREQLKIENTENFVLRRLAYLFTEESDNLSKNEKLLSLNRVFLKKDVPKLREYIENIKEKFIITYSPNKELLEKFIEMKEKRDSEYSFIQLIIEVDEKAEG